MSQIGRGRELGHSPSAWRIESAVQCSGEFGAADSPGSVELVTDTDTETSLGKSECLESV